MVQSITKFKANDGKEFDTREEAEAHESAHEFDALLGLTEKEIADALAGDEPLIADTLERVGGRIAKLRRERGDLRRASKARGEAA